MKPTSGNSSAFTLAELLIALAILGVIATFTIPKILQAQQNDRKRAAALEAVSTLSGAFQAYRQGGNTVTANTRIDDMTPFINYVKVESGGLQLDDDDSGAGWACDSSYPCLLMANGGYLHYMPGVKFNGTATTNAIALDFDPDGKFTSGDLALGIFLYTTGRITSYSNVLPGTTSSYAVITASPDPAWFHW